MKVNIEDVLKMQEFRNSINHANIDDIEWYQDGKKVSVDKELLEEWKFIGLNNTDFITMGFFNGTLDLRIESS